MWEGSLPIHEKLNFARKIACRVIPIGAYEFERNTAQWLISQRIILT